MSTFLTDILFGAEDEETKELKEAQLRLSCLEAAITLQVSDPVLEARKIYAWVRFGQ